MSYHKFVEKCRNPHKGLTRETSGRALVSSHPSCFSPTPIREALTEKQEAILNGTVDNPRKTEVSRLLNKLEHYERYDDVAQVYDTYGYMFHEVHEGDPTPEEALKTLDDLTPDDLK